MPPARSDLQIFTPKFRPIHSPVPVFHTRFYFVAKPMIPKLAHPLSEALEQEELGLQLILPLPFLHLLQSCSIGVAAEVCLPLTYKGLTPRLILALRELLRSGLVLRVEEWMW